MGGGSRENINACERKSNHRDDCDGRGGNENSRGGEEGDRRGRQITRGATGREGRCKREGGKKEGEVGERSGIA